jgi:hypothetical protein
VTENNSALAQTLSETQTELDKLIEEHENLTIGYRECDDKRNQYDHER